MDEQFTVDQVVGVFNNDPQINNLIRMKLNNMRMQQQLRNPMGMVPMGQQVQSMQQPQMVQAQPIQQAPQQQPDGPMEMISRTVNALFKDLETINNNIQIMTKGNKTAFEEIMETLESLKRRRVAPKEPEIINEE